MRSPGQIARHADPLPRISKVYPATLWVLLGAFCLRVAGQMLVAFGQVCFLPPMEEWFSGAISYPKLLASQLVIIVLLGRICRDVTRGSGYFAVPRRRLGSFLIDFGGVYLGVMVLRYVLRMELYRHERWTGGSIPIFFHWVLAAFLLVLGHFHRTHDAESAALRSRVARAGRILAWLAVASGVLLWTARQVAPWWLGRCLGARPTEYAVRIERNVSLKTTAGVRLVSDVYHPQRLTRTPTVLVRAPLPSDFETRLFTDLVGRFWAERGYTVVIQRTRGCPPSGGRFYPLRPDRQDGKETLLWLAKQPWFNGRIGMWGGSAFGYTQWALADLVNPGPSALIIYESTSDFYRMFYPGGAFSLGSALFWALRSEAGEPPDPEALKRGFEGFSSKEADDRALHDISFFNDWATHRRKDDYWREIDMSQRVRDLHCPVLLLAGWRDAFLPAQLEDFAQIGHQASRGVAEASRLIIGPWTHGETMTLPGGVQPRNFRLETLVPSVEWFDRYLVPSGGVASTPAPAVRIYVMGDNVWRDETEWPPARVRHESYYLRSGGRANTLSGDGRLETRMPGEEDPPDVYTYDPRHPVPSLGAAMIGDGAEALPQNSVEKRQDVLVYGTPPLRRDLEVTGDTALVLYVETPAPSADFTAKLVDVYPNGSAYLVSDGILRREYEQDPAGRPVEIRIDLWPTSYVYKRGHRLRLEVGSSSYPRFDLNPGSGSLSEKSPHIAIRQTIHHGRGRPSRLILPVIPRNQD
jgi:uncharacterized protein